MGASKSRIDGEKKQDMSNLKTMNPSDIWDLLDGVEDTLTPEIEKLEEFFAGITCPECGDDVQKVLDVRRPFRTGSRLPNYHAECVSCRCLFSPYTNLIIRRGARA